MAGASSFDYEVFLSHSSPDKPTVEELARRLKREGIEPFLDKWNLIPGQPWQEALEEALTRSASCAVFIGPGQLGPWQNEEMRAALDHRVRGSRGKYPVIPVLLPGAIRPGEDRLPLFLKGMTWVVFPQTLDDERAFHRLVCGIRGREPGPDPGEVIFEGRCPYRGLEPFGQEHAPFFFGREVQVGWLLKNVLDPMARSGRQERFLAILGPSGSGKSSLALAGLVPALRAGKVEDSSGWPIVIFRPGYDPLESLAIQLSGLKDGTSLLAQTREFLGIRKFGDSPRSLHVLARLALRDAPASHRLVVLADQFEEVFTLCDHEPSRGALIDNLLDASTAVGGQTLVLLTMRADFYGKCAAYPPLAAALSDRQELVGPLGEDELRRAIEGPARLVGCELEPGLTDLLLQDVEGQAGALPLLQYTLLELWTRRQGRRLTIAAYREIGEVQGALERRANEILESFSEAEREICRRVFLRLTQPGEGTEDTKRRAFYRELLGSEGDSQSVEGVIRRLADARLITLEGREQPPWEGHSRDHDGYVEVAHEALIRGWTRLRQWIDADRAGLRIHRQLTEAAREWKEHGSDASFLYQGTRLAVAKDWAKTHSQELDAWEREFLEVSLQQEQKRQADEVAVARQLAAEAEARRQAEAARAQEQTDAASRLRRRAWALGGTLMVTLIFAILAGILGLVAQTQAKLAEDTAGIAKKEAVKAKAEAERADKEAKRAEERTHIAEARRLAAESRAALTIDPQRSLLLAVEAINATRKRGEPVVPVAITALQDALLSIGIPTARHGSRINEVTMSPDGSVLATGGEDGVVRLWKLDNLDGEPIIILGHAGPVLALAFSPDAKHLVTASGDKTGRLWDLGHPEKPPLVLLGHTGAIQSLAISPDGRYLATASFDGTARLWDLTSADRAKVTVLRHEGPVSSVAFTPDARRLATSSMDGTVRLWDSNGQGSIAVFKGHMGPVSAVAFTPDGRLMVTGSFDGTARLWDPGTGRGIAVFKGHTGPVSAVAFTPDGRRLVTLGGDRSVLSWLVDDPSPSPTPYRQLEGRIYAMSISPNGQTLVTGSDDGSVRVWNFLNLEMEPIILRGHKDAVRAMAFSPGGQLLITGSFDGTVRVWNLDLEEMIELAGRKAKRNLTRDEWNLYFAGFSAGGYGPYRKTFPDLPEP